MSPQQSIGHYRIISKLGEGGMGAVYRATDTRLGRDAAIKVLPADKVTDPDRKRRFVQEAKAASALNHPNIVTIYEIGSEDGVDFIAMEYVAGKTLEQLIERRGMRVPEVLRYGAQIADALAKAHSAGIVHRDLKPGNIMVSKDGLVKVLDFGLAKLTAPSDPSEDSLTETISPRTEAGAIVGTVSYMSPEQAEGKEVDPRSDVFAFGAVLYEMLTGQPAFDGGSRMSTLAAVLSQEPEPLCKVRSDVPLELDKLILRCLRKDRERRPQHAADVRVALLDLKEEFDSGTLLTPSLARRPPLPRRFWKFAAAAVGLAAVAMAGWLMWGRKAGGGKEFRVRPLTSFGGEAASPTFAPDGNQVAFSWNGPNLDNTDIYVKLLDSGPPLRLTTNPAVDDHPSWSPDGRQIAFLRTTEAENRELMLISPLGGVERKLTELSRGANAAAWWSAPAWTPDGKFVAVRDDVAIVLVSTESGEKRRLTSPPPGWTGDKDAAISPDGGTLAFARIRNGPTQDLFLAPLADGSKVRQLTHDNVNIFGLAWTGDGQELVFSSARAGDRTLWRVAASGGTPERLPVVGPGAFSPAIARRGGVAAFVQQTIRTSFWRLDIGAEDPRPPVRLMVSSRADSTPMVSPDGRRIAFTSDRSGSTEVWVCDSQGADAVQLTSLGFARNPYWSPDSHNIVFEGRPADRTLLFVIPAGGGKPRQLTSDDGYFPSWSRDGRWIYYYSRISGAVQTWKVQAEGGNPIQLTKREGGPGIESADGKDFYYHLAGDVWKVPVEGGEQTVVVKEPVNFMNLWTLSGRNLYFVEAKQKEHQSILKSFDLETGQSRQIAVLDQPFPNSSTTRLSLPSDNRWLLYNQLDRRESDIMLIPNFR